MNKLTWMLILVFLGALLISCATTEQQIEDMEPAENSGHVVLETFVGEQVPVMRADLLTWNLLPDSSIEITGTISDANQAPLAGITICLLNDAGELIAGELDTNEKGEFSIGSTAVRASDHIVFKHADYETLDLVIKELKNSNDGMLVKYERVILP